MVRENQFIYEKTKLKSFMLIDNAPVHPKDLELLNIKLYFQPNTTSLIQLLDQVIIKTFKDEYKKLQSYIIFMMDIDNNLTFEKLKAMGLQLSWIYSSPPSMIRFLAFSVIKGFLFLTFKKHLQKITIMDAIL